MRCLPPGQRPPSHDVSGNTNVLCRLLGGLAVARDRDGRVQLHRAGQPQSHSNPLEAQPKNGSIRLAMAALGWAPTMRSTSCPPLNTRRAGMLRMLKRSAVIGFSSTFNFPTRSLPRFSAASCSMAGAIILHGPHHGAHMSSSTGKSERSTSAEKLASVIMRGCEDVISGVLHRPQTGCRP